ncbi:hypothetical protein Y032_0010g1100 [Ancylostoma ceylanicum]|uniref:Uncharacterized protein n=1 Tax=Ancylostoma ceylanicum TaxID=53326 RepID=A0A016VGA9_9BILA|nr:hypothetical protein Y032_0010g1100 [Ancylostoma ceylanicum]
MNPCLEDHVGPREVKMETLHNRCHGERRRRSGVDDAVYIKDHRGQKPTWAPGFDVRRTGNATYSLWRSALEPPHQPTIATKQHFYSQPNSGRVRPATLRPRADTNDSTPEDATDLPTAPLRRSSRQLRAPDRPFQSQTHEKEVFTT